MGSGLAGCGSGACQAIQTKSFWLPVQGATMSEGARLLTRQKFSFSLGGSGRGAVPLDSQALCM